VDSQDVKGVNKTIIFDYNRTYLKNLGQGKARNSEKAEHTRSM
jgi:hypothetical protein